MSSAPPRSFRTFVLKIHARCDLACDYCYVYQAADQSWRSRPRMMSVAVARQVMTRIVEHATIHGLSSVDVTLHGGEPLLCGIGHLRDLLSVIRSADSRVRLSIQTNAMLLDEAYLDLFDETGVNVGVSLDGGAEQHNLNRRSHAGLGTYRRVAHAVRTLAARPGRFGGLLCTIDLRNDPIAVFDELVSYRPPIIDFLLPHGTWDTPPPGRTEHGQATPYADWLIPVFDQWFDAAHRPTAVRLFDAIIDLLLGGQAGTEGVGPLPSPVVVVETDGTIERTDALKVAYDGAAATGLHVGTASFDDAAAAMGPPAPASQCVACPLYRVCGGGHPAHRYRSGSGFVNRSVYCPDLYRLITHISGKVTTGLALMRA
ncbi:FxsB family cyclophane-forming radical SAM/SPASM peptide maturase [Nonomuraea sp. NPDC050540]|uniref:FxsB family cyclophane-forming radical SAM/SPASM peptide maturase n=1 Tax=Nonomuraea sp. NPDC050540 TaxID=3364367 RepID=UPI0037979CAE